MSCAGTTAPVRPAWCSATRPPADGVTTPEPIRLPSTAAWQCCTTTAPRRQGAATSFGSPRRGATDTINPVAELRLDEAAVSWRHVDDDIVAIDLKRSDYITVTP